MFEKQIAAGMAWLDANKPGWVEKINLKALLLRHPCKCIMGQVIGNWCSGWMHAAIKENAYMEWSDSHGFSLADDDKDESDHESGVRWWVLESEWIAAIRLRQSQVTPARATRPAAGVKLTAVCLR